MALGPVDAELQQRSAPSDTYELFCQIKNRTFRLHRQKLQTARSAGCVCTREEMSSVIGQPAAGAGLRKSIALPTTVATGRDNRQLPMRISVRRIAVDRSLRLTVGAVAQFDVNGLLEGGRTCGSQAVRRRPLHSRSVAWKTFRIPAPMRLRCGVHILSTRQHT